VVANTVKSRGRRVGTQWPNTNAAHRGASSKAGKNDEATALPGCSRPALLSVFLAKPLGLSMSFANNLVARSKPLNKGLVGFGVLLGFLFGIHDVTSL